MAHQAYKVVNTHAHEISGWKILSKIPHETAPHIGGINDDVQSYLSTLVFKNIKQLEGFHRMIFSIQQKIILSGGTVSYIRLLLKYMK